jgi:phosphoadenosine phosphosulfate reductase
MTHKELKKELTGLKIEEQLMVLADKFPGKIIFTTSLGLEDQAITHMIFKNNIDIKVITLDTGRLFSQTYDVMALTKSKYKKTIHVYFPDYISVEKLVTEKGPYSFYDSVENRKECCKIRKVVPLNRALLGMNCWVSGIRADQSENRTQMDWLEFDEEKKMFKFHPLYSWTYDEVKSYVKENDIPYNTLHNKGYVSIGCEPCTKAIKSGEDFRAGRWWWEKEGPKECGCHAENT